MQHIHRYQRVNIGKDDKKHYVMRCKRQNCHHYTQMHSKLSCPLLLEKVAECNRCGNPFLLDKRALRMANPCCEDCIVKRRIVNVQAADSFFESLMEEASKK